MPTTTTPTMPLAETGQAPYTPAQVAANLREFLNQLDRDPEWVRNQCISILSRGIAEHPAGASNFPTPDFTSVCEAGPSIGYTRPLSPVELCEAFEANPKAMQIEMPDGWNTRDVFEGGGMWRICEMFERKGITYEGKEISCHRTFGEARRALSRFMETLPRKVKKGEWAILKEGDEEPWLGEGIGTEPAPRGKA